MGRGEIAKEQPLLPSCDSPGATLFVTSCQLGRTETWYTTNQETASKRSESEKFALTHPFLGISTAHEEFKWSHQTLQCKNLLQQTMRLQYN